MHNEISYLQNFLTGNSFFNLYYHLRILDPFIGCNVCSMSKKCEFLFKIINYFHLRIYIYYSIQFADSYDYASGSSEVRHTLPWHNIIWNLWQFLYNFISTRLGWGEKSSSETLYCLLEINCARYCSWTKTSSFHLLPRSVAILLQGWQVVLHDLMRYNEIIYFSTSSVDPQFHFRYCCITPALLPFISLVVGCL